MSNVWFAVVDVAIAAAMLYYVYTWLVRTRSAAIVLGVLALLALYFTASALQLQLTTRILQGFYTVALLAIIVIFQPELRRILENVGFIGGRGGVETAASPTLRTVAETAFALAAQRVGALILLRGRGPVDRHITGGVPLDGAVSSPLLASLFDTSSPGHDGAVLIDGDRVVKFGCYLPLSTRTDLDPQFGTRHRAGLGISEVTDGLAVIVSEETGEVTVALEGRPDAQADATTLEQTLLNFRRGGAAVEPGPGWLRRLAHRPMAKLGALAVAAVLWVLTAVPQESSVRAQFDAPILYENLAESFYIGSGGPEAAQVELEGPPDQMTALQQDPPSLVINLAGRGAGTHAVPIMEESFSLPEGVRLLDATPKRVEVRVEPFRMSTVPVAVEVVGHPAEGYQLGEVSADPPTVQVLHKADALPADVVITTDPVDVEAARKNLSVVVALVWPTGLRRAPAQPEAVTAQVEIREVTAPPLAATALPASPAPANGNRMPERTPDAP